MSQYAYALSPADSQVYESAVPGGFQLTPPPLYPNPIPPLVHPTRKGAKSMSDSFFF